MRGPGYPVVVCKFIELPQILKGSGHEAKSYISLGRKLVSEAPLITLEADVGIIPATVNTFIQHPANRRSIEQRERIKL